MTARIAPARRAAYEVLRRVFEHGAWADRAFGAAAARHALDRRERAQAQRLAYGAVQRRGTADHLVAELSGRPAARVDPPVAAALRLGLYELLYASGTPEHAAVDQAVELASAGMRADPPRRGRASAASGFANAVLRRAAREGRALVDAIDDSAAPGAAVVHSYPEWLARLWFEELGPDEARSLMAAMNEPAETALRVNALRADPVRAREEVLEAEPSAKPPAGPGLLAPPEALAVHGPLSEGLRRRLAAGELVAQARGSQAVVSVLDPRPGERILDLCAAPGIKATAIAGRLRNEGEVVAVEIDPGRARQLRELCRRLGASCVRVIEADAARTDFPGGYDRVLVDPPCSDLGTLASRPDARWRKAPDAIERLARIQGEILSRAARSLRDGGILVYATCTISARENELRVAAQLAADPTLRADDLGSGSPELASRRDSRFLQLRPDRHGTDGFFIARLRREATTAGLGV